MGELKAAEGRGWELGISFWDLELARRRSLVTRASSGEASPKRALESCAREGGELGI
jgi:hypothetical protein